MDKEKVISNINALANGVNPNTGEVINEGIFNDPEIVRTLFHCLDLIRNPEPEKKKNLPENAGKPWTAENDADLIKKFGETTDINLIMKDFKRTKSSIIARLAKLGLIDKDKSPFEY